ncbi:WD40-repeat-containing domain protein [Mycena galopus ATCC 62051]|nr:WD40-repeat-containing domain protein [Mycena galopus ATCC 62051]
MPIPHLPYVQHHGVQNHPGSVLTLAATEDGTILASGGSQGTRLWDVTDMLVLPRPSTAGNRGATLVLIWARQTNEAHNVLYAGTQNGYFFCWRQKYGMPDPGEITAMAFDSTNNRLCLCSRNNIVQSWAISKDPLTSKWIPTNIFSRKFPRLAPQAITFVAFDNSQDQDIIVLGLHNSGPIYTIRGKTGENASDWSVGAKIGDAAFNWKDGVFCLDDPASGPALFRLSDQVKSKTYEIERKRKNERPRKVRFGEHGATLVCSSDHGCVYVFDTRSGERLATLSVGSSEWVQVVATAEVEDVSVIFAAQTRALDSSEEIFVWKRAQRPRETSTTWEKLSVLIKALVILGCVAFMYQNVRAQIRGFNEVKSEGAAKGNAISENVGAQIWGFNEVKSEGAAKGNAMSDTQRVVERYVGAWGKKKRRGQSCCAELGGGGVGQGD